MQGNLVPSIRCKQVDRVDTLKTDPNLKEQEAYMRGDACDSFQIDSKSLADKKGADH